MSSGAGATLSGVVIGTSALVLSSFDHPYLDGSKITGSCSRLDFQISVCTCARLTFSVNASVVGGNAFSSGVFVSLRFPVLLSHASNRISDIDVFLLLP